MNRTNLAICALSVLTSLGGPAYAGPVKDLHEDLIHIDKTVRTFLDHRIEERDRELSRESEERQRALSEERIPKNPDRR